MEYRLKIDAYSPTTIPMGRLAAYMVDFATLLGETGSVHFVRLDDGSTVVVSRAEREADHKVQNRINAIRNQDAPQEAQDAFSRIDDRLAEDNATGEIETEEGAHILQFPGRQRPAQMEYGAFTEPGAVQGQIISIGGKRDRVSVHIQEGEQVWICHTSRERARELAKYIFGPALRIAGSARWERDRDGRWHQNDFTIRDFELLNDEPLSEIAKRLQAVDASWKTPDALKRLSKINSEDDN